MVGEAWKELGESEKAVWNEKAKKDKLRYQKEMENYSAPSDNDSSDDDSDGGKGKKTKAKSKSAKKDPNAPKRPMVSVFVVKSTAVCISWTSFVVLKCISSLFA